MPYFAAASVNVPSLLLMNSRLARLSPLDHGGPETETQISRYPSLLMSTMVAPVAHRSVLTPADSVMSSNRMLPLFRYRRLETMLPAKKMSGRPSLSISPTAPPPPL